jgi:hypothetical protein
MADYSGFQTFDLGNVIQTAETIKAMKNQSKTDALREQYLRQQMDDAQYQRQRQERADQVTLGQDKAKEVVARSAQILQQQDPKGYIEKFEPVLAQQLHEQLSQHGFDWQTADANVIKEHVAAIQNRANQELGAVPESYTLGKDQVRYQGNNVVARGPVGNETEGGFNLGPGQGHYGPDGKLIAERAPDNTANNQQNFQRADKLRDEFNNQSKEFIGVANSFKRIQDSASNPSPSGDLSLIFNYMKVLDPGSTVREGEFATAQNAGSVDDRVQGLYNRIINGERLSPDQRSDFLNRAGKLYKGQEGRWRTQIKGRYENLAKKAGVDPTYVVSDFNVEEPQTQQQTPTATATGQNGEKIGLINGQWVPLGQ